MAFATEGRTPEEIVARSCLMPMQVAVSAENPSTPRSGFSASRHGTIGALG